MKRDRSLFLTAALLSAFISTLSGCGGHNDPITSDLPVSYSATGSSYTSNDVHISDAPSSTYESSLVIVSDSSDAPPESSEIPSDTDSSVSDNINSSVESSSSSVPKSEASSSAAASASSSSSSEDPPPVVVIPDFAVPTSPGVKIVTAKNGVLDYSNADDGYISATYTGDKAKCKLQVIAAGETYNFDVDANGQTQYFPLSMGNGTYTIVLRELVDGTAASYSVVLRQEIEVNMKDPRSPYLYSNRYVNFSKNSDCVYKAAELCAGIGDNGNIEKIAAIFQWVTSNITYDHQLAATVKKNYCPDPDTTLKKKTGICYDYASLMAAMLRSQHIPTRLVIGDASPDIYHAWNEIYTEQTGWITPELLLKNNGYNIADATFYASAKDKQQISDYISNSANYYSIYYY